MVLYVVKGFLVSASLITAIGSQNIFVLKQGLMRRNIFYVCLLCFACDIVLMGVGVLGVGMLIDKNKVLLKLITISGIVFLVCYGFNSFLNAYKCKNTLTTENHQSPITLRKTIMVALAITLLNPHVYLDTVVIIGGISGTLSFNERIFFLMGALLASFIWFFCLGYGARMLSPLFKNPITWRILNVIVGCIVWWVAYRLILYFL